MKLILKILKAAGIFILSLVLLIAAADAAWIYVPQLKAAAKIDDVDAYAHSVSGISVPGGVQIVALGEASHGNSEFQTLRLTVLMQLIEGCGVRAFALECDFGEAAAIDSYIHGGSGTAEEVLAGLSFTIYHTSEMARLIDWMRAYNDCAAGGDMLSFYGFDMQNPQADLRLLGDFCAENSAAELPGASEQLYALAESAESFSTLCVSDSFGVVADVRSALTDNEAQYADCAGYAYALHAADCIAQAAELAQAHAGDDYIKYNNIRDGFMADNVLWIAAQERALGRETIMVSGHNGHIAVQAPYYTPMGAHLREHCGSEYFVIGTDYFKTLCNINSSDGSGRGNHRFCSADPLAAQAKRFGGSYYLRFDEAAQGSAIACMLAAPMTMGSLGEGYSALMKLLPTSHRVSAAPAELYDAMIFVYSASPIAPF